MDRTASGALERMKENVPVRYDTSVGSYIHDVLAPAAIEFETAYGEIENTFKRVILATATGDDLDTALSQLGFKRKAATYATGEVTVTGATDAAIEAGALVAAGRNVYEVLETAELTDGSATVPIRAQNACSAANVPVGAVNYFPVTLPKITSVTNAKAITGGADKESDEEYFERYQYFLDHPVTSGNQYEYEQWAMEIEEVGLARCIPVWNGGGTVKVVIATRDFAPAGDELVLKVKEYIESKRLIGVDLTVASAELVEVEVSVHVVHDDAYVLEDIRAQYLAALDAYCKEVSFAGGIVPYTEIGALLQSTPGVLYYDPSTLLVNGDTSNVVVEAGQLAAVGGVTFA